MDVYRIYFDLLRRTQEFTSAVLGSWNGMTGNNDRHNEVTDITRSHSEPDNEITT